MGLFDGSPGDNSGLMGMYANPQMAGLLGMSQGLLSASGPSRIPVSMGQALGAGMGGMQQGAGNALNLQRQMYQMQALQGLSGMGGAPGQPAGQSMPGAQTLPPVSGMANMAGLSGPSAGMGQYAPPTPVSQMPQPGQQQPGPTIYGKSPQQLFQQGMMMNIAGIPGGADLMKVAVEHDPTLAMQMPTDMQKNAAAAYGTGTPGYQNAIRGVVDKEGIVALRPGAPYIRNGQVQGTPGPAPMGFMNQPDSSGGWTVVPVPGGTSAVGQSAAAQAGGRAQYELKEVWDPNANGGQGGMVQQTVANAAESANPGAPAPLRNNNPGALMPGGKLAQFPDMQTGLTALDTNLQTYGKQGVNTLSGVIGKWAPPSENNTQAYIQDVSQRLGIKPDQPIDLGNPAVRQAISTGIMLHENGPQAVFSAPRGGPMASQPPLGQSSAANASQGAPSKQMADSYSTLSNSDSSYQQSREAITEMLNLAHNKGASGVAVGLLPSSVGTKISPDAAMYQKLHATYVAMQGKALGSGGTDASRATINEAVPTYDKPQSAMVGGLTTQLNNLDLSHIKTQFLTPIYQQGNEKTYTQQSAAFDQNVKPSMIPVLTLSGDAQRTAVQAAVKANPAMRASYEWAFQNGLLK